MPAKDTALTAPNQSVQGVGRVTYAYRRFGNAAAGEPPLVLLQHFRGNRDNWDSCCWTLSPRPGRSSRSITPGRPCPAGRCR